MTDDCVSPCCRSNTSAWIANHRCRHFVCWRNMLKGTSYQHKKNKKKTHNPCSPVIQFLPIVYFDCWIGLGTSLRLLLCRPFHCSLFCNILLHAILFSCLCILGSRHTLAWFLFHTMFWKCSMVSSNIEISAPQIVLHSDSYSREQHM